MKIIYVLIVFCTTLSCQRKVVDKSTSNSKSSQKPTAHKESFEGAGKSTTKTFKPKVKEHELTPKQEKELKEQKLKFSF